jgi:hypothetical protein
MGLSEINTALAKQRAKVSDLQTQLAAAQARNDTHHATLLRYDLESARRVVISLDEQRRAETPVDARTDGVSRGAVFYGTNHE